MKASDGALSVLLSIHQPNSRILGLFDHLLLIERGCSIYFGPLADASSYFADFNFVCPPSVTPSDYFLKISDSNFEFAEDFDFEKAFASSSQAAMLNNVLDMHKFRCEELSLSLSLGDAGNGHQSSSARHQQVSFWRQFYVLLYREYALAYRDPTLYYLQAVVMSMFAFIIGVIFWELPFTVNGIDNVTAIAALIWFTMMFGTVHIFKVYYMSAFNKRIAHELANNYYGPLVISLVDTVATATIQVHPSERFNSFG